MRKVVIVFIIMMPLLAVCQVEPYLTLAAENNPGLKAKFNAYLAAMERIPQAQTLPDPQVTFGLFVQPVETRVGPQRASLAVSQAFPWFGTLKAQGAVATQMADAKLKLFEDAKLQLFSEVRVAYDQLYLLDRSIALTNENLDLLSSFKELARVNFESGKTGFVNVLRVEMEEKELQTQLAYWEDSRTAAKVAFEKLLNTPVETIQFGDSLEIIELTLDKQVLYDSIIIGNPKLQSIRSMVRSKEELLKVTELNGKPSFTLGASYVNISERSGVELPDNGQDAFVFPQVGLKIPIYRKKYKAQETQVTLEKEGLEYQIEEQNNRLVTALEGFIRDHLDAKRRVVLYQNLHDLAGRSLSLLQTEFTTGTADFEEVLRMERKLLTYQLEIERARVETNRAIYQINYIIGK